MFFYSSLTEKETTANATATVTGSIVILVLGNFLGFFCGSAGVSYSFSGTRCLTNLIPSLEFHSSVELSFEKKATVLASAQGFRSLYG